MTKKQQRNRRTPLPELRQFLFRSTGGDTDPRDLSFIDVYDNLIPELDRMAAIAELMRVREEELMTGTLEGVGMLLDDIESRMRAIMQFAIAAIPKSSSPSPRRSRPARSPS